MNKLKFIADCIDAVCKWIGEKVSLLMIPLVGIAMMEVILRYVLNRPTIWAWDVTIQIGAALIALAGAYTLQSGLFVRVDLLVDRLPRKAALWLDLVLSIVPLFAVGVLVKLGVTQAIDSCLRGECLASTWMPPIYPLRIIVAVGFILLLLQIVSRIIRNLLSIVGSEEKPLVSAREENR
ncbi:MAG: TRAP transporter small permease subunit [Desulfobacterales bacterium]|nr:TRAP transporter small permease subunit [Desulfobacterales bacterium]